MAGQRREQRKTERFHQIPIFGNLSGPEVGRILRICEETSVPQGTPVFRPGDPTDGFYIILEGRVDIRIPPKEGSKDPTTIATLGQRSVFGEMSFLNLRNRSAWAVAAEDCRLQRVKGPEFYALTEQGDTAAFKVIYNFAKLIAERLRLVEEELLNALDSVSPEKRQAKLAELQQFRKSLYTDWSF
jgi:CRP-like cAMP-binding protein